MQVEYIYVVKRAGAVIMVQHCVPGDSVLHVIIVKRLDDTIIFSNDDGGNNKASSKMMTWSHVDELKQNILYLDMRATDRPEYHFFHGSLEDCSLDKCRDITVSNNSVTVKNSTGEIVDTFSYERWVS